MIRETIKSLFTKGSFTQDVAIVGSGKILVGVIGFVFIPILSRIYLPEAYGLFSIYNATVTIIISVFTLKYPNAFAIIEKDQDFIHIFLFSLVSLILGSIILFLLIPLFRPLFSQEIIDAGILYLIPVGIIINGFIQILLQTNLRRKIFLYSATINVTNQLSIRLFNLSYGLLTNGNNIGLVLGNQFGGLISIIFNGYRNYKYLAESIRNYFSIIKIKRSLSKYINYPKYIFPTGLINILKTQLPIYVIGIGFNKSLLGEYSMALSLLNIPIQIIGYSVSSVFLKKANDVFQSTPKKLSEITYKTLKILFIFSFIPFSIILVFGPQLFNVFLGDNWNFSGQIASIYSVYFILFIVIFPANSLFQVFKKEKYILLMNIFNFVFNAIALIIGIISGSFINTIIFLTVSESLILIIQGYLIFRILQMRFTPFLIKMILTFISSSFLLWILKTQL